MFRLLTSLGVVLALMCMAAWSANVSAQDKTHEGKIVKAGDGKLTMTLKDGKKEHTHEVAKTAKITLDGKKAKLDDLKDGMPVTVTTNDSNVVTIIEARTAAKGKLR
jgi:hypothetical protein